MIASLGSAIPIVAVVLLVFAALGYWRGWLREVTGLGALVVAWLALQLIGTALVALVNRAYLIATFTLRGGFDAADATSLLRTIQVSEPIDRSRPEPLYVLIVALVAIVAFLVGNRTIAAPSRWTEQALGAVVGAIHGFAVAYVVSSLLAGGRVVSPLATPSGLVNSLLAPYVTSVIVVAVLVGLLAALTGTLRTSTPGRRVRSA